MTQHNDGGRLGDDGIGNNRNKCLSFGPNPVFTSSSKFHRTNQSLSRHSTHSWSRDGGDRRIVEGQATHGGPVAVAGLGGEDDAHRTDGVLGAAGLGNNRIKSFGIHFDTEIENRNFHF